MSILPNHLTHKPSVFRGTDSRGLKLEDSSSLESDSSENWFSGMSTAGTKKLPGVTPTENNSRNKGNTARVDRERQRWTGREAPKKGIRTGVKCKSKRWKRSKWKKMALYWGKFKERSRALPSKDTKSLKVGCPGKQDPCPFSCLNFSQDFHLQVWALGTYFKVSPAQISRPLSLLRRLYSQLCHAYTEKKHQKSYQ